MSLFRREKKPPLLPPIDPVVEEMESLLDRLNAQSAILEKLVEKGEAK